MLRLLHRNRFRCCSVVCRPGRVRHDVIKMFHIHNHWCVVFAVTLHATLKKSCASIGFHCNRRAFHTCANHDFRFKRRFGSLDQLTNNNNEPTHLLRVRVANRLRQLRRLRAWQRALLHGCQPPLLFPPRVPCLVACARLQHRLTERSQRNRFGRQLGQTSEVCPHAPTQTSCCRTFTELVSLSRNFHGLYRLLFQITMRCRSICLWVVEAFAPQLRGLPTLQHRPVLSRLGNLPSNVDRKCISSNQVSS